ncbi:hypothetical protein [Nocardia xishanensis]|uniref:hypothetical protein n=1 Tax=Nocardia xishanensis TaxID=238964 RepID=UPI000837269A|nr:hypothetical protein [Nocardia xishanensis]
MSDQHSVEDEIAAEARRFSAAMRTAMQRHAQATGWLERRRARKEISRLVRQERRDHDQIRGHHRSGANQAVDRYRIHAQAVAARANDPRVDHERRTRDARALAQHRDDLAKQFVTDPYLTRTEQGIVLDGLDAASVFPEFRTGNLFARAHKVKGIEALRYRARVARETVAINERAAAERAQWQQEGLDDARRAHAEEALLARIDAAQPDRHRYTAQAAWTDPDGGVLTESRSFATEHTATAWLQGRIHGTSWAEGTTLSVETRDTHNAAKQYVDRGRPETVVGWLAAREAVLRERTLTGQVHREDILAAQHEVENRGQAAQQDREPEQPEADLRFHGQVSYLPEGADRVVYEFDAHTSKADTAAWIQQQVAQARPAPGTTVQVSAYEESSEGRSDPLFWAAGRREEVADEVAQWRIDIANVAAAREQDPDRGVSLEQVVAERDQLRGELDSLTQRHQLSIEHNGELTDRAATLEQQLTAMTAERDQLRGQRDEAVRKLAERTPADQRYGSPERQAEQARQAARSERTPADQRLGSVRQAGRDRFGGGLSPEIAEATAVFEAGRKASERGLVEHVLDHAREAARAHEEPSTSDKSGRPAAERQAKQAASTSPLAGFQPGSALADAVARNGHDREGMER